jgi:hypothetical protein
VVEHVATGWCPQQAVAARRRATFDGARRSGQYPYLSARPFPLRI